MKHDTLRFHYGNSWLMAALVAFLLLCIIAMLRGADGPPPPPGFKPVLHSPKGAESLSTPMSVILPPQPPPPAPMVLNTCNYVSKAYSVGTVLQVWPSDNTVMQSSNDMKNWQPTTPTNGVWCTDIIGWIPVGDTNRVFFRAVPR